MRRREQVGFVEGGSRVAEIGGRSQVEAIRQERGKGWPFHCKIHLGHVTVLCPSSCPTQPFDKSNPYHLRRAFGDLDPAKLVRCYKRPLRHVRFEDEIEHPLKTNDDGVWFVKTAEVPPKILIRRVLLLFIVVKCGR